MEGRWRTGWAQRPAERPAVAVRPPLLRPPGTQERVDLDARANAKFQEALDNNQRGDNRTILGVLFAVVLFFAAESTRFLNRRLQYGMLTFASVAFRGEVGFLVAFPKLI